MPVHATRPAAFGRGAKKTAGASPSVTRVNPMPDNNARPAHHPALGRQPTAGYQTINVASMRA